VRQRCGVDLADGARAFVIYAGGSSRFQLKGLAAGRGFGARERFTGWALPAHDVPPTCVVTAGGDADRLVRRKLPTLESLLALRRHRSTALSANVISGGSVSLMPCSPPNCEGVRRTPSTAFCVGRRHLIAGAGGSGPTLVSENDAATTAGGSPAANPHQSLITNTEWAAPRRSQPHETQMWGIHLLDEARDALVSFCSNPGRGASWVARVNVEGARFFASRPAPIRSPTREHCTKPACAVDGARKP